MEVNNISESDRSLLEQARDFLLSHPVRRCYCAHEDGYRDANGKPIGQNEFIPECDLRLKHLGCPHAYDVSLFNPMDKKYFWAHTYFPLLHLLQSFNFLTSDDYNFAMDLPKSLKDVDFLMRESRCGVTMFDDFSSIDEKLVPLEKVLEVQAILYPQIIDPLYDRVEELQTKILTAIEQALSS